MNNEIVVRKANCADVTALSNITFDCVAGGASIGFMSDVTHAELNNFWAQAIESADCGERIILVAERLDSQSVVGTVQLVLRMPKNQPHRADVAKLQVHREYRKQGVAEELMKSVECVAQANGRTLLVLDTVSRSAADKFYRRLGWVECGEIPNFALWPSGEYCSTTVFYKQLELAERQ